MDKYACDFACTYMHIDDDDLYRIQLLQALRIEPDARLSVPIDALFEDIGSHFASAIQAVRSSDSPFSKYLLMFGTDASDNDAFSILFSMDLFQYMHACICYLHEHETVDDANMQRLLTACRGET